MGRSWLNGFSSDWWELCEEMVRLELENVVLSATDVSVEDDDAEYGENRLMRLDTWMDWAWFGVAA